MSNSTTTSIRISQKHKELLKTLADQEELSLRDMMEKLIDSCTNSEKSHDLIDLLELDSQESDEVRKAEINTKTSIQAIAKEGLIQRAKYLNNINNTNFDNIPLEELRTSNVKGVADYKIRLVIDRIKEHNLNSCEPKERIYISPSLVQKLSGSNFNTVKKWFENHHDINEHNSKYELGNSNNRRGSGFDYHQYLNLEFLKS